MAPHLFWLLASLRYHDPASNIAQSVHGGHLSGNQALIPAGIPAATRKRCIACSGPASTQVLATTGLSTTSRIPRTAVRTLCSWVFSAVIYFFLFSSLGGGHRSGSKRRSMSSMRALSAVSSALWAPTVRCSPASCCSISARRTLAVSCPSSDWRHPLDCGARFQRFLRPFPFPSRKRPSPTSTSTQRKATRTSPRSASILPITWSVLRI